MFVSSGLVSFLNPKFQPPTESIAFTPGHVRVAIMSLSYLKHRSNVVGCYTYYGCDLCKCRDARSESGMFLDGDRCWPVISWRSKLGSKATLYARLDHIYLYATYN